MSVYVSGCVWKHAQAKGGDLLVLLAIAEIAGEDGIARPQWDTSIDRLSRMTRLSRRAVQYCIRNLESTGEVVVGDPGPGGRANTYQILLDRNHSLFDGPAQLPTKVVDKAVLSTASDGVGGVQPVAPQGCNLTQIGVQPIAPDPSDRLTRQPLHRGREKAGTAEKPSTAERVAAWSSTGITPALRQWAQHHGWAPFLDRHLGYFVDYLAANPGYATKHPDLDAAFRNCVRGDWGNVRRSAQLDAQHGRGVDLVSWWLTADGMKAKGFAMGLPWAPDKGGEPLDRQWRRYEAAVLSAAVDREGWGAWVDPARRTSEHALCVRYRKEKGLDTDQGVPA